MRRDDDFPQPVSDPAAAGVPDYADDDSTAWDDVESTREADGRDPAPLPPDREDGPLALDEYGTTAEEQRLGEPLEDRLAREEPDVATEPEPDRVGGDASDERAEVPHEWSEPGPSADDEPLDPGLGSSVSLYERIGAEPVGRLVQPDAGIGEDTEADEVAFDAGAAGGGPSAEEAAVHETRSP